MSGPRTGRVFPAVAFTVLGAVLTLLLTSTGVLPGRGRDAEPGVVDVGFAQDMIVHHQQAVTMAQAALDRLSPPVAQVATGIELNQLREIGQLQGWLTLWDAPQVASGPPMAWMDGHGHAHRTADGTMPGLASVDEVNRLGDLDGRALDIWFLQLMVRHHEGTIAMTSAAARSAGLAKVRSFAGVIAAEQQQETATMTGLLAAYHASPLPSSA